VAEGQCGSRLAKVTTPVCQATAEYMQAFLFRHALPRFAGAHPRDVAAAAAALLYFESVRIGTLLPIEDAVSRVHGMHPSHSFVNEDEPGLVRSRQPISARAVRGATTFVDLRSDYGALIAENIVQFDPMFEDWAKSLQELSKIIDVVVPMLLEDLGYWAQHMDISLSADALVALPWIEEFVQSRLVAETVTLEPAKYSQLIGLTAEIASGIQQATLAIAGRQRRVATLFDSSYGLNLHDWLATPKDDSDGPAACPREAWVLFAEVLRNLPCVIPRSAESVLTIRASMKDELAEFSHVLDEAIADLHYQTEKPTSHDLRRLADQRFSRPLRQLERRLAHPNREMLRNLVRTETVLGSVVGLTMATVSGLGSVAVAGAALAVATASAAIHTALGRREAIESSHVGFLFQMRARFGEADGI
jgi:hypothetical protein